MKLFWALWLLLVPLPAHAQSAPDRIGHRADYADCGACHGGIQALNADHDFPCARCHLRPEDRGRTIGNHRRVVRYPASPSHVETFCGECHRKEIDQLRHSLHWTLAGMINQTRFLWGLSLTPGCGTVPHPDSDWRHCPPARKPFGPPRIWWMICLNADVSPVTSAR